MGWVIVVVRDGPQSEVIMIIKNDKVRWVIGTAANLVACVQFRVDQAIKQIFGFDLYRSKATRPFMDWLDNNLIDLMAEYDHREDPIF